jgi:hypothetical protein
MVQRLQISVLKRLLTKARVIINYYKANHRKKLSFCQLNDWDEDKAYNEDPPSYIHYSIEWKVTVNNRVVSKDTEPDMVLAPGSYW